MINLWALNTVASRCSNQPSANFFFLDGCLIGCVGQRCKDGLLDGLREVNFNVANHDGYGTFKESQGRRAKRNEIGSGR